MRIPQSELVLQTENLGLDPAVFAKILEFYKNNNYSHLTGIKITALGPGKVIGEMAVGKQNSNMSGILHGGATATLIDVCMGLACFTKGVSVVTTNINVSYLEAGKAGEKIIAVGQVVRAGKTAFFAEASVENEKGRIIAKGTGTFFYNKNFAEHI